MDLMPFAMAEHTNTKGTQKQQQVWFGGRPQAVVPDYSANLLTAKG
jgi:hypothetical protein